VQIGEDPIAGKQLSASEDGDFQHRTSQTVLQTPQKTESANFRTATPAFSKVDETQDSRQNVTLTKMLSRNIQEGQTTCLRNRKSLEVVILSFLTVATWSIVRYEMTSEARFCGALPT
jgi:hypothetical protein